jgi:hypothetical protein
MKKTFFYSLAFVTFSFVSCEKDNTSQTESKTDILTKSSWKFETFGVDTDGDFILTGNEIGINACDMDDVFTFSKNGILAHNFGADICASGGSSILEDSWQFYSDETFISYIGYNYKIKTLTQNKLEIYYPGPASSHIVVFKR